MKKKLLVALTTAMCVVSLWTVAVAATPEETGIRENMTETGGLEEGNQDSQHGQGTAQQPAGMNGAEQNLQNAPVNTTAETNGDPAGGEDPGQPQPVITYVWAQDDGAWRLAIMEDGLPTGGYYSGVYYDEPAEAYFYLDPTSKMLTVGKIEITEDNSNSVLPVGTYYFDERGMEDGRDLEDPGEQYGRMVKSEFLETQSGEWLNLGADGIVVETQKNDWNKLYDVWYYLDETGTPMTGWLQLGKKYFYLSPTEDAEKGVKVGQTLIGWQTINNKLYYLGSDPNSGAMKTGWQKIDGKWYYFGTQDQGAAQTGWKKVNNKWFYMDPETYVMLTDWQKINNKWYYLTPGDSGAMKTGWQKIGTGWFYLTPGDDGSLKTGWQTIGNGRYYLGNDPDSGRLKTGWQKIDGTWYYLGGVDSGRMRTGWQKVDGGWFYLGTDGKMRSGFTQVDGNWYYLGGVDSGKMRTGWQRINNQWYYMNSSGVRQTGEIQVGNKQYLMNSNGVMLTGWQYANGYKFYYSDNGAKMLDLRSMLGAQSSYRIEVNRRRCIVTILARDGSNGYIIPVVSFACSVGLPATPTPTGTFRTPAKYRWHMLMGPSYGQYCTRIVGGVLFHSVAGSNTTSYNLSAAAYNMLGQPASHGCVRLTVRDAKWIYDNCALGTTVRIYDSSYNPFPQPATIKIPAGQTWDPTDPAVA